MYTINLEFGDKKCEQRGLSRRKRDFSMLFFSLGCPVIIEFLGLTDRRFSKVCIFVSLEVGWASGGPREGRGPKASLGSHRP